MCLAISSNSCSCYRMPQNAFFLRTRDLLVSQKTTQRLFFHPPSLSTVIFATATVSAFVLLRSSRFNFHCYTQREAMPTQKSAQKCAATSHNFLHERLQSTFTLANQLHWIAQYKEHKMNVFLNFAYCTQQTQNKVNTYTQSNRHTLYDQKTHILVFIKDQIWLWKLFLINKKV